MKVKGMEIGNCSIWVNNKTNLENYLEKLEGGKIKHEVLIVLINVKEGKKKVYNHYCEDRKVATKILRMVREDLQKGLLSLTPNNYETFLFDVYGEKVIISIYDSKKHKGNVFCTKHNEIYVPF